MALRWRILAAFVLLIALSVLLTSGVSYLITKSEMHAFLDDVSQNDAYEIASELSIELRRNSQQYPSLRTLLADNDYLIEISLLLEPLTELELSGLAAELGSVETLHIQISDAQQQLLLDNLEPNSLNKVPQVAWKPNPEMAKATVYGAHKQIAGYVYVEGNRQYIAEESRQLLSNMLLSIIIGGLITIALATLIALWFSHKITAPISALTNASQTLANTGDAQQLAVTQDDELGKLTHAFNQMLNSLKQQRQLRKQLISDVSHDINTPLSVIRLEASGLRDGMQNATTGSQHIIQELDKLQHLVADLSWMAETDSGEFNCPLSPQDLGALLQTEVSRFQLMAEAKNIQLTLVPMPDLPLINLNLQRFSQALGNLLSNALQYCYASENHPQQGKDFNGHIEISVAIQSLEKTLTLKIQDNGIGIAAEHLEHVRERFYRVDQVRNQSTGNRGLGLAISKTIIKAHHGELAISSEGLGKGSCASITLPLIVEG